MKEMTYAQAINEAMSLEMRRDENVFLMGEDVGRYGVLLAFPLACSRSSDGTYQGYAHIGGSYSGSGRRRCGYGHAPDRGSYVF
jgi:hypothetical protein